jgi:glycosyltransferase involved in cell wall biosynthesis
LVDHAGAGVLGPPGAALPRAKAVRDLALGPARRRMMRAAGLAKAQTYSWPRVAEQVMAVYRRVRG